MVVIFTLVGMQGARLSGEPGKGQYAYKQTLGLDQMRGRRVKVGFGTDRPARPRSGMSRVHHPQRSVHRSKFCGSHVDPWGWGSPGQARLYRTGRTPTCLV
jgi:hypothetical protein